MNEKIKEVLERNKVYSDSIIEEISHEVFYDDEYGDTSSFYEDFFVEDTGYERDYEQSMKKELLEDFWKTAQREREKEVLIDLLGLINNERDQEYSINTLREIESIISSRLKKVEEE